MEMKVNSQRIRDERQRRAWSQEHLAEITGLGLRTIQRIESSGGASNESIAAIASVMAIPLEQLIEVGEFKRSLAEWLMAKRLWLLVATFFIASMLSPPQATSALAKMGAVWIVFELTLAALRWKHSRA